MTYLDSAMSVISDILQRILGLHNIVAPIAILVCITMTLSVSRAAPAPQPSTDLTGKIALGAVDSDQPIFAFPHGGGGELRFELKNISDRAVAVKCSFTLTERDGPLVRANAVLVSLPAQTTQQVAYKIDPDSLRYAVYDLDLTVTTPGETQQGQLAHTTVALGITSASKLRKALDGEFLYGLDTHLGPINDNPALMEWTRVMGADILRGPFMLWEGHRPAFDMMKEVEDRVPTYKAYDLRVMVNEGPEAPSAPANWRLSDADFKQKQLDFVQRLASSDPTYFVYWELGNEPDIGFYQGPKEQYAKDFVDIYHAIKKGNPKAVVVNGGFAYDTANVTKILRDIGPENIDAVAYHAHGPGVGAERHAFQIIKHVTTALNFPSNTRYLDTESGMDAEGPTQEITQAITATEKLVFAQTQHMLAFFWFRLLFEHPDSYSTLKLSDPRQPRPAVLSYRATVEALRGLTFDRSLDFGVNGLECHAFRSPDGKTKCCVLWMDLDAPVLGSNIDLSVAANDAKLKGLQLLDLFGNPSQLKPTSDGRVHLLVGTRPIFVKWTAMDPTFEPAVGRPDIVLPSVTDIRVGHPLQFPVVVHNPYPTTFTGSMQVTVHAEQAVHVSPTNVPVTLPPFGQKQVTLQVNVPNWRDNADFPHSWRAFLFCDPNLKLSDINTIPDSIPGPDGKTVGWTPAYLIDNTIDLQRIATGAGTAAGQHFPEKSPAVLFAELDSDSAKTISVGAAADYWMEWTVNGQTVFTTIPQGNGAGYTIHSHLFSVPLKRGRNLFAVKILAGSQGWRFVAGGPSDLSHGSLANVERMDISLVSKDKTVVATGTSLINYRRPAPVQSSDFWAMRPADWGGLEPTAKLGEAQVTNLFFKDPDTSRWWKGDGDLSAIIWLRQDSSHIYTVVEVTDDIDKQASNPADMAEWDHINIALAGNDGKVNEWAIGRVADAPVVRQVRGDASPAQQVRGAVDRDANRTLYRFAIPRSLVTGDSVRMNVIVTDNDDGYRKQYASWTPFPSDAPEPSPDRWQIIELR